MNFIDMIKEIYNYSTNGCINHETKTLLQFQKEIKPFFEGNTYPIQVALEVKKNGCYWYCVATRTAWGYDYYIPTDRQDEERLKRETGYYD